MIYNDVAVEDDVVLSEAKERVVNGTRGAVISKSTRIAGAAMAAVFLAAVALDFMAAAGALGDAGDLVLAFLTLVPLFVAAFMLPIARSFHKGTIRTQWMMFGLGTLAVGIGGAVYVALVVTGNDPYPSIADVFTLAGYGLFAYGLYSGIRSYRELLDIRTPLLVALGVGVAVMALVYFTVIGPYVIFAPGETQPLLTRVFNTLYPVLDVFVLLMPAVALGLLVSRLGAGRVAWPWWCVIAAALILAITDALFAYAGYAGWGRIPLINAGYALAPFLLGFAVLLARDVYRS